MKKMLLKSLILLGLVGFSTNSYANTLLSGNLAAQGAQWYIMDKGYLFNNENVDQGPVNVSSITSSSSIFSGANSPSKVSLFWMTSPTSSLTNLSLTVSDFKLFDASNSLLLSASLIPGSGSINIIPELGQAGEFNFLASFNINGGSLYTSGVLSGAISTTFNYTESLLANNEDFHFTNGSFSVSEVPEPTTSVLLLSSLAGVIARRKRTATI